MIIGQQTNSADAAAAGAASTPTVTRVADPSSQTGAAANMGTSAMLNYGSNSAGPSNSQNSLMPTDLASTIGGTNQQPAQLGGNTAYRTTVATSASNAAPPQVPPEQQAQQLREQYQHKLDYVEQQKREAGEHKTSVPQGVLDLEKSLQDSKLKETVDAARAGRTTPDTASALASLNGGTSNNGGSSSGTPVLSSPSGSWTTGNSGNGGNSGANNNGGNSGTNNNGGNSGTNNNGGNSGTTNNGANSGTNNNGGNSGTNNNGGNSGTNNNGGNSNGNSGGVTINGQDVSAWHNPQANPNPNRGVLNGMIPAQSLNVPIPVPLNGGEKKETPTTSSALMPASNRPAGQIAQSGALKGIPNGEDIEQAAKAEGVSPYLLAGVAAVESGNNAQDQVLNRNIKDGPLQVNSGVWNSPENTAQNAQMATRIIKKYTKEANGDIVGGLNGYNTGSVSQNGYAAHGNGGASWPTYADGVANAVNNVIAWEKGLGNYSGG